MCEIKITISAPDLADAIKSLAEALSVSVQSQARSEPVQAAALKDAGASEAEKPAELQTTPEPAKSAAETNATPSEPEKQPVNARIYTITELSKAGADLLTKGKMGQLVELLKRFGVQALTQVPKEKYGDLALGLIELGAQL
ncbi:MAG: hypothetical protein LUD27_01945 [Clostridia bacterium]|nr:hypothetical protein [Clostridia bacterium]